MTYTLLGTALFALVQAPAIDLMATSQRQESVRVERAQPANAIASPPTQGGPIFDGRQGQLVVTTPRMDKSGVVDGVLNEPEWANAAVLTGFSQFFPADGVAAQDSTQILVWYSPTALHVGIRAFAPPGTVRSTLANRDRITQDDNIQLFLGTYGDSRQAMVFGVNPFGIQSDGVLIETGSTTGGGFSGGTAKARENADLAPDYVWESKGLLTPTGYEVEISIPFKSLRYRAGDEQKWQLHVIRTVQATGHEESWAPAVRGRSSFLEQSGMLIGLHDLRRGITVDVIPTVTSSTAGTRNASTDKWGYTNARPELGGSLRWGLTSNLTVSGTANPDFSQVEADATQFTYDPRQAVFFAERRPFFLESQEQFATPSQLIYTRRITQPIAAAKLAGKHGGFDVGLLSAVDNANASLTDNNAVYNILRLQRDLGTTSRIGLAYTDKIDGSDWNRVLGIDGRIVRGRLATQFQVAGSASKRGNVTDEAPLWNLSTTYNGRAHYMRYNFSAISPDFDAQSGFISRTGISVMGGTYRYTILGAKGARFESIAPEVSLNGTWRYDDLVNGRSAQDVKSAVRINTRVRGGWQFGGQVLVEQFGYDRDLFRNYFLFQPRTGGGVDTVPYTGTANLNNLDLVLSMSTPEFKRFSFNTFAVVGQDENFDEWSSAKIVSVQSTLNVRPTDQLRITGTVSHDVFNRKTDGSRVQTRFARRIRTEYQLTRQMFIRVIGEYSQTAKDALRDDSRSNLPVYLRSASGSFSRASAFERTRARVDALVSYLPTPGTVFYFGYGDAMQANEPNGPERLRRVNDVYFLKLSYLFRMQ